MRILSLSLLSLVMLLAAACAPDRAADEASLRALDQAYAQGWKLEGMQAQEAAIMPLMHPDAVIMPGRGTDLRRGEAAIRAFWFPEKSPETRTTEFEHNPQDISIDGDLGVISGRYTLQFEYDGDDHAQEGNYLTMARRQAGGKWLITRIIWNDRNIDY